MTRLRHYDHDGRARFITINSHQNLPIFSSVEIRNLIIDRFIERCHQDKVRVLAYCLMPEHFHFVIVPPLELKIGPFVGRFKLVTSMEMHNFYLGRSSTLLQRLQAVRDGESRFVLWMRRCYDRNCRNEKEIQQKVDYCHWNPVKRRLVRSPELWKWSSYQYHLQESDDLVEFDIVSMYGDGKYSDSQTGSFD